MIDLSSMPALCINLDSRPDRWRLVNDQFSRLGWAVTRIPAVEANYPPGFDYSFRWRPRQPLNPGQRACMASHRLAWGAGLRSGSDVFAVFEDDAVFPSDFNELFPTAYDELPEDWRIWHLHSFGPVQDATSTRYKNYLTDLKSAGYGSHGYFVKRDFVESFLLSKPESETQPVDVFLTLGVLQMGFKVYGTHNQRALCFQSAMDSDIKETSVNEYYSKIMAKFYR